MDKRNLAFGKTNFILLAIGVAVVIIGFILMSADPPQRRYSTQISLVLDHITVAPIVTFIGFISIIGAILYQPKETKGMED